MGIIKDLQDILDIGIYREILISLLPSGAILLFDILLFFDIYTNGWAIKSLLNLSLYFSIPFLIALFLLALIANLNISALIVSIIQHRIFKLKGKVREAVIFKVVTAFWANLILPSFLLIFLFPIWLSLFVISQTNIIMCLLIGFTVLCVFFTCLAIIAGVERQKDK